MAKQNGEHAGQYITFDDTLFSPFEKVIQIPAKDPGLGKGYVSPHVPLAKFEEWEKILPFYPHIPPAPRFHSNDWIVNLKEFSDSQILRRVGSHLFANTLVALVIYLVYWFFPWTLPVKMLSPIAHSLTGTVLGLLLVFRTNSAYARVYDARCIWGQLTNTIREMSRLAQTNMQGLDREHALMLTAALPTLMLNHLQSHGHENNNGYRNEQWSAAQKGVLTDLLSQHDFRCIWAARNRPMCCAKMIGAVYRSWFCDLDALKKWFGIKDGRPLTADERAVMAANIQAARLHMEHQLEIISNCYGACERIVRSNVPAAYSRHTSRFLSMWCFTLPLVLVDPLKWMMVPTVALLTWSLLAIEEVGHSIEDPFNVHLFIHPGPNVPPHLIDILIIEGSQNNLREDTLERCPGPQTRLIQKPRYEGDELDYDLTEWHREWKRACKHKKATMPAGAA